MKSTYPGSLHNHTDCSNWNIRDSINTIESLFDYALELGHEVLAITEHENIMSSIHAEEYYDKIKKDNPNFKLIRGNEIYLVRNGLNSNNFKKGFDRYYHFILLAKDSIGHQQIREISSRAFKRSYMTGKMRRVPTYYQDLIDIIGANPGHVIASTACLGGCLPTQLIRNRDNSAPSIEAIKMWIKQMVSIFGEDFYFEMQPSHDKDQIYVNKKLVELSNEMGIKYIITNDAHYLKKEDRPIHKAFLNAQEGEREVDSFYATTYLMEDSDIRKYLEDSLGEEVILNSYKTIKEIKNKCKDYSLKGSLKIPELQWKECKVSNESLGFWSKKIPYLNTFLNSEYKEDKQLVYALVHRLDNATVKDDLWNQETADEINECLKDTWISSEVNGSRWSAYYLNLQNIIDCCWDAGTLVGAGRGSGVGFILLYLLGITQINPLREKSQTKRWRFLNPERVSVLDVDIDIESTKRASVLKKFRDIYGDDRVANVLTLKKEKSRSAILTAARGLGIDVDIASSISSLIQDDRGQSRTLKQTFYGDKENNMSPNIQFQKKMEEYPKLWEVAQRIEGLICGIGVHAGGVIFVDEPFTNTTALMRAPSGEIITQFELHDAEKVGLIKYDILSVEALDKIHNCIDLICEYGYEKAEPTLKETYEKIVGVYNLERYDSKMWEMCWNHKVLNLFQMEKQSGLNGISAMKPTSVDDLAILNSAIRLMATEKGGEMPVDKLARFKAHPEDWDYELSKHGLDKTAKDLLNPILSNSYGLCIAQEQFMQLVQLPELGGFDLTWADKLRKSIAKKNPAEYDKLTKEYFKVIEEKGLDYNLCDYVWNNLIAMSKGYGFNLSHTLAYSIIGLQELNLGYRYPIILWNCACLISNSGGAESDKVDDEGNVIEEEPEVYTIEIEDFLEDEEEDEESDGVVIVQKKKQKKGTDYGKIATAIGKMMSDGIKIVSTDINKSGYTFSPDVENNRIIYGLSGITRVGDDIVNDIIKNRPYTSIEDFLETVKVNKPQMINLIKSGAFDSLYGGNRVGIMRKYIDSVCDKKKKLTLSNVAMLIKYDLIPKEYKHECTIYRFNKYIRKFKNDNYFKLDAMAYRLYEMFYDVDLLTPSTEENFLFFIEKKTWEKIYKKDMLPLKEYIKDNQELLDSLNSILFNEVWNEKCEGNLSKWEMDALSCYIHEHELAGIHNMYNICDYNKLSKDTEVDYTFTTKRGQEITMYRINRIAGTVLQRDKSKRTVDLLTTSGVVTVKIFGDIFTHYNKQISEKKPDGTKRVIEKSWLTRGNKIIVTGIRKGDTFIAKKYKKTPYHLVELIESVNDDGSLNIVKDRVEEVAEV